MPVLSIRIIFLDSFYPLIFYSEKFSFLIWCLPFDVNVALYLSTMVMDTILQYQKENVLQNNNTKKLKTPYMCYLFFLQETGEDE